MPVSLGLYIDDNLIKYAKVSKERDSYKVEAFGMKFYDKIDETIKQIINETYSFKTPISINLTNAKYSSSELFSLLNPKDLNKAAKTEFEFFCEENHKNKNALEYRNVLSQKKDDRDKLTCVFSYTEKSDIEEKNKLLSGYRVTNISPLPLSVPSLLSENDKTDRVIVNIENNTSVTFMTGNKVTKVELIEDGMKSILDNIILRENSYAKAYEICKNTTIYTMQGKNLQAEENEYMEDIMPTLYKIVERVKEVILTSGYDVREIYITGLAAAINNIDLYFGENFPEKKCEILAPFFVEKTNIKINIKDYIEVNSAIALALQGLGTGYKEINFKRKSALDIMNIEIGGSKNKGDTNKKSSIDLMGKLKSAFDSPIDVIEMNLIRIAIALFILLVIYIVFSGILSNRIDKKDKEINDYLADSRQKISELTKNKEQVTKKIEQYNTMVEKINEANEKQVAGYARKNVLPNFLTEIMSNIPKEVQLTSIQNTSGKNIKIEAKSKEYEQLGYFIAKIKNESILTEVTSTSGTRQNEYILVTIEGKLPY